MIAFGPIPSRRLGLSLGINNIVSHKVCSYGCVYCQIGETRKKTLERQVFYDPEKLVEYVGNHLKKLDKEHKPDYLTFVANGEPTLDVNLGKEIVLLKKFGIPVALITNSSLMYKKEVRDDLMEADWVSVKVDTVDEALWRRINRPAENIGLKEVLEGLMVFASAYIGMLHTETMLLENYNDAPGQAEKTASFIAGLKPLTAFLSVPTRPPALKGVKPIAGEKIAGLWQVFQNAGLKTELLTGFEGTDTGFTGNAIEDILNITAVHPLREDTMAELLRKDNADLYVVFSLINDRLIKEIQHEGKAYYVRNYNF